MKSRNDVICYLCDKKGADTKDHVPPKCFLNDGNFNNQNRITLPAHKSCNQEYSEIEEYVRDLIGPTTSFLKKGEKIYNKTLKSWNRKPGQIRKNEILKKSKPVLIKNSSGIITGKGIAVEKDRKKMIAFGKKIAKGLIYFDTDYVISNKDILCADIPIEYLEKEKDKELKKGNPFWVTMTNESNKHYQFDEFVFARINYQGIPLENSGNNIEILCSIGFGLYTTFYVIQATFNYRKVKKRDFSFFMNNAYIRKNDS